MMASTTTTTRTTSSSLSPRPRRSSLTQQKNNTSHSTTTTTLTRILPRKSMTLSSDVMSTTMQLSKMVRVITVWRDMCLDVKNETRRRVRRSASWKLEPPRVGFHPPRNTKSSGQQQQQQHDVRVEEIEFDPDEAVYTMKDPSFVTQDHDDIPWYEQDYEELPWWEYPDLEQDDEVTALCKEVIRESLHNNNNSNNNNGSFQNSWQQQQPSHDTSGSSHWNAIDTTTDHWEQTKAARVEAIVMSFALKLQNRVAFTKLQKQQMQAAVQMELVHPEIQQQHNNNNNNFLSEMMEPDWEDISLGGTCQEEQQEEDPTVAQEEEQQQIQREEQFQHLKQQQILNLQHDQQEAMHKLLHPSTTSSTTSTTTTSPTTTSASKNITTTIPKVTKEDVAKMMLISLDRPRQPSPPKQQQQQSPRVALDDDSVSLHSAVLSTGWNRLNIHNSERRRYQQSHRLRKRKHRDTRGLWADDHTVLGTDHANNYNNSSPLLLMNENDEDYYHQDDNNDDGRSISSFQSSPAMMEYTKTKQSWFHHHNNNNNNSHPRNSRRKSHGTKEPKKLIRLTTSATYTSPTTTKPTATLMEEEPPSPTTATTKLGRKKKKKKKKKAGHLALFMAKEEMRPDKQQANIFDIIMEEEQEIMPESSQHKEDDAKSGSHSISDHDNKVHDTYLAPTLESSDLGSLPTKHLDDSDKNLQDSQDSFDVENDGSNSQSFLRHNNDGSAGDTGGKTLQNSVEELEETDNNDDDDLEDNNGLQRQGSDDGLLNDSKNSLTDANAVRKNRDTIKGEHAIAALESKSISTKNSDPSCSLLDAKEEDGMQTKLEKTKPTTAEKIASNAEDQSPPTRRAARRASGSGELGYRSMHCPSNEPRLATAMSQSLKEQDYLTQEESQNNLTPKAKAKKRQPFVTRRASFSELEFCQPLNDDSPAVPAADRGTSTSQNSQASLEDAKFRLVMLRHAAMCTLSQRGGVCPSDPKCSQMKELLRHMTVCKHQSAMSPCPFPGCQESKSFLITMHKNSKILAQQREFEKNLPPIVTLSGHARTKLSSDNNTKEFGGDDDEDDISDIASFGSAGGVHNDDCSEEGIGVGYGYNAKRESAKQGIQTNSNLDMSTRSEHQQIKRGDEKSRGEHDRIQRRPSWAGSVELKAQKAKRVAKDKALQEKIKKEEEERQKMQAYLRRKHDEVKMRLQARALKAKKEKEELEAKRRIEVDRKMDLAQQKMLERQSKVEAKVTQSPKQQPEQQRSGQSLMSGGKSSDRSATQKSNELEEKRRQEEKERQRAEAEIRQKHLELKARMGKGQQQKSSPQGAAVKSVQMSRKSFPANTCRMSPKPGGKILSPSIRRPTVATTEFQKAANATRKLCISLDEKNDKANEQKETETARKQAVEEIAIYEASDARRDKKREEQAAKEANEAEPFAKKAERNQQESEDKSTSVGSLLSDKVYSQNVEAQTEVARLKAAKLAKKLKKQKKRSAVAATN